MKLYIKGEDDDIFEKDHSGFPPYGTENDGDGTLTCARPVFRTEWNPLEAVKTLVNDDGRFVSVQFANG